MNKPLDIIAYLLPVLFPAPRLSIRFMNNLSARYPRGIQSNATKINLKKVILPLLP
jgi:hypothetical protein